VKAPGDDRPGRPPHPAAWTSRSRRSSAGSPRLRKELAQATGGESCIETAWGRGCVLRAPDSDAFDRQLAAGA
jgi:hypothetical protein